jgi:hypothetical protein
MNRHVLPALKSLALVIGFTLIQAPAAQAAVQNVACDGDTTDDATPSDTKKIRDALTAMAATSDLSHVLNLSGACAFTLGGISIQNFPNIIIQGPASLTAPSVACNTTGPSPVMVLVSSTRNVTMRQITISGGGSGVVMIDSGGSFTGVSISGARGEGLSVQGASTLGLQGVLVTGPSTYTPAPNNITNNCGNGINVGQGSSVSYSFAGTISGNGGAGVSVNGGNFSGSGCCAFDDPGSIVIENNRAGVVIGVFGGTATVNGGNTCAGLTGTAAIRNNTEWGIFASGASFVGLSGKVTVENNQTAPTSATALAYRAGIFGSYGATIFITPGSTIKTTNQGAGILVDAQSKLRLGTLTPSLPPGSPCTLPVYANTSITLNGDDGIRANNMSFMEILSTTSVTANTGKDAKCDDTSILVGVKSGVGSNKCK